MNSPEKCQEKCPECPLMTWFDREIAIAHANKEQTVNEIEEFMQHEEELRDGSWLQRVAQEIGIDLEPSELLEITKDQDQLLTKARQRFTRTTGFKMWSLDTIIRLSLDGREQVQQTCPGGPVTQKRYLLFGRTIIACASLASLPLRHEYLKDQA